MEIVYGKIREILPAGDGTLRGFVIDGGLEVHVPQDGAKHVAVVAALGSRLEICGNPYRGPSGEPRLDAQFITNLDSNRSVNLQDSPPMQNPEVPLSSSPTSVEAAPLAPPSDEKAAAQKPSAAQPVDKTAAEDSWQSATLPADVASHASAKNHAGNPEARSRIEEDEAARSIELAYDGLHRAQALLAYTKIVDLQAPDVSELFNESRHTYQQAVSSYQRQDYAVAGEFAAASGELSRSVEVIVSRTLRADSSYPTLVPTPPAQHEDVLNSAEAQNGLARVGKLLARIHWLVQNGTLPSEDREQVRRIASWSDVLYSKGQHSWKAGAFGEASYFISAAEAVAHSAEHICKQDYIAHVSTTD